MANRVVDSLQKYIEGSSEQAGVRLPSQAEVIMGYSQALRNAVDNETITAEAAGGIVIDAAHITRNFIDGVDEVSSGCAEGGPCQESEVAL